MVALGRDRFNRATGRAWESAQALVERDSADNVARRGRGTWARLLLRVRGGTDQPAVLEAIRRAGGERDGTREFWWLEVRRLRQFAGELRRVTDPLLR
jgi:hypothetical protein